MNVIQSNGDHRDTRLGVFLRFMKKLACEPSLPESFESALDRPRVFHYKLSVFYLSGLVSLLLLFLIVQLSLGWKVNEFYLTRTAFAIFLFTCFFVSLWRRWIMNRFLFWLLDIIVILVWLHQSYAYMSGPKKDVFEFNQPIAYVLNYTTLTICFMTIIYHNILRLVVVLTVLIYTFVRTIPDQDTTGYNIEMAGRILLLIAMFVYYTQYYYQAFEGAGRAFEENRSLCQIYDQLAEGVIIFEGDEKCRYQNKGAERLLSKRIENFSDFMSLMHQRIKRAIKRGVVSGADPQVSHSFLSKMEKESSVEEDDHWRTEQTFKDLKRELQELDALAEMARGLDEIATFDLEMCDENSTMRYFEVKTQRLQYGAKWSLVVLISDVTQMKEITKMREVEEYKDLLLASVTHELRTPLNCMIPLINEALEQPFEEQVKNDYLYPVLNNAKLLLSLVSDILDYSKLRRKSLRFILSYFSLDELLHDLTQLFEIQIRIKGLYIQVERDPDIPDSIYGEKDRTRQILINLISNAIKFTRRGGIKVEVGYVDDQKIRFSVVDTGIGISPEDQIKLFKAFGQVEAMEHLKMNTRGTGLGLMISNNLAKMLGAERICLNSAHGQGSIFYFDIFYRRPETSEDANFSLSEDPPRQLVSHFSPHMLYHPLESGARLSSNMEKKDGPRVDSVIDEFEKRVPCLCRRVLIADDNDYSRLALTKAIRRLRLTSIEACDGQEAYEQVVDLIREEETCGSPHCRRLLFIISDLNMPRMDGVELRERVRGLDVQIPFVLSSAFDPEELKEVKSKSPWDFTLSKPVSEKQLAELLKEIQQLI